LKSVHEIDLQLYRKYGLSVEEINFIETHVKEMV
jgi:type II restriction enzyme